MGKGEEGMGKGEEGVGSGESWGGRGVEGTAPLACRPIVTLRSPAHTIGESIGESGYVTPGKLGREEFVSERVVRDTMAVYDELLEPDGEPAARVPVRG